MNHKIIVLIAPPLGGKNTFARLLCKKYDERLLPISRIDFGFYLRKRLSESKSAQINSGNLLPNQIIFNAVDKLLKNTKVGTVILDGYPRSLEQAYYLNRYTIHAIQLDISLTEMEQRAENRITCVTCGNTTVKANINQICECGSMQWIIRPDDKLEIARKRYLAYQSYLPNILNFYKSQDKLVNMSHDNCNWEVLGL